MITQDVVRRLWDEAGFGNVAVWEDETITVVPADYPGDTAGRKPLVVLKPLGLVNRFSALDVALADEELLSTIEERMRTAGGRISRA